MGNRIAVSSLLVVVLFLTACRPVVLLPVANETVLDTASLDVLETEIQAASMAWDEAFNSGDLDALLALYADDAVDMPPGFPALEGVEAIAGDLQYILEEFDAHHETSIIDIKFGGDLALERASYTLELTPKSGGDTVTEAGKHLVVRQKLDDEWKVLLEIWYTDSTE